MYSAGFGALGLGPNTLESTAVRRIDALEGRSVNRIRAGWGWAAAVKGELSSIELPLMTRELICCYAPRRW